MKRSDRSVKEKLKLDQMMRVLFRLSKRLTVQLVNGLFGEQFANEEVKSIHYGNAEFIMDGYDRIVGDLFLKLVTVRGTFQYHVEFQTLNDQSMVIRMFRYGFEKAVEVAAGTDDGSGGGRNGMALLAFPRQIVIFLEENEAVGDELAFRLLLPSGVETVYTVPTMRYWTLTPRDLQERRLFALLPLQVFRSRKSMRGIADSHRSDEEKRRLFAQEFERLKTTIGQTLDVIRELHHQRLLRLGDIDRLLQVLDNILKYLYNRYGNDQQTEEVSRMIKTFIDPEVLKKGRREGQKEGIQQGVQQGKITVARKLLKLGVDIGTIVEATELSEEEVLKLGKQEQPPFPLRND
ncbi:hypothetical protein B1A99_22730 [Cohnella sp. CIP 111063]|uniref:hypothetical protein n=1 Tax=unclassified Cohnella TaxID=2636738 RepID=UPI000B8BF2BA|nr:MULTISPECIES: hypothetical protein [unclassified Cohnella]OXS55541.1 hypothetical protein B1A99_22730 [Cohnella sp. CIP 111063]PRX66380.1 putative transposase/invertase (TIGR01784 family) [Cohnella sp. SGD-V74]